MVSARDAHDDWYDDEPYGREDERPASRSLELVRPAPLAFELIRPQDFEDAQRVADRLRGGVPVLIDLHGCDPGLSGRLVDFASGLVYALEASLQHVGDDVLLLAPRNVHLSGDEASDVRSPGFYNRS